jgi:hypothetical protein
MRPEASSLALAGIALALVSYALAILFTRGTFSRWAGGCGNFGLGCLGQGIMALGVGCLLGTLLAALALGHADAPTWHAWLALLMNGLPLAAIGGMALLIAAR